MRNLLGVAIATLCLAVISHQAHAAWGWEGAEKPATKERLVLMPLRVGDADKSRQNAMETALIEGLQQKYEVLSGELVAKKAREIFMKESRNAAKRECDETRCLQGIAEAFQAELIATANVSKQQDGYFLALSIQNIFDNKVVYSKSVPCKNCDAYQVVDKLKELSGAQAPAQVTAPAAPPAASSGKAADPETAFWEEVQKGNSADDYGVYLAKYPKGKYVALAKERIEKLQEQTAAKTAQQDQSAWDKANKTATEASYQSYLKTYPQGQYATLATARISKLRKDTPQAAASAPNKKETPQAAASAPQNKEASGPFGGFIAAVINKEAEQAATRAPVKESAQTRPKLPFKVSENIWRTIEASEAYRNSPRPRAIKVSYQAKNTMEYTGSKSSALPKPVAYSKGASKEVKPLGSKCSVQRYKISQQGVSTLMENYSCGGVMPLGSLVNGKATGYQKSIELQGSLFPMRVGAELSMRSATSAADSKFDMTISNRCRVVSKGSAHDVHPKLTGVAWAMSCETSIQMPGANINNTIKSENYFLEDLGVFLSDIGEMDMSKKKIVLPSPGSQTVLVAEGEYGSRTTSTYQKYDWKVGD